MKILPLSKFIDQLNSLHEILFTLLMFCTVQIMGKYSYFTVNSQYRTHNITPLILRLQIYLNCIQAYDKIYS